MKQIVAALLFGALVACAAATPAPGPAPTANALDPAACAARHGTIRPVCRMQKPACVITYADAGKTCSNKTDCEGRCVREINAAPSDPNARITGQCQANSDPCGCRTEVDGGKALPTLCVD